MSDLTIMPEIRCKKGDPGRWIPAAEEAWRPGPAPRATSAAAAALTGCRGVALHALAAALWQSVAESSLCDHAAHWGRELDRPMPMVTPDGNTISNFVYRFW